MILKRVRNILCLAVVLFQTIAMNSQSSVGKLTSYVNPFIGTGAVDKSLSGNNFPGAVVPFGMIQLSSDTRHAPDWAQASGYDYNDKVIVGFSHTHLSGTGVAEFFDVLLMPTTQNLGTGDKNYLSTDHLYESEFSHKQESASPGYYQVDLLKDNIKAELTATERAGFHRYAFPLGAQANVIIDLDHSLNKGSWSTRIINSQIRQIDEYTLSGYRLITGWAKLRKVYFYIRFSKPIKGNDTFDGNRLYTDNKIVNGSGLRSVFNFGQQDSVPLLAKVGLSGVSIENARQNLDAEIKDWDFDYVVQQAGEKWEKELQKIQVEATELQKEIFYTALYHTHIQPNIVSDVNGDYTAIDYTKAHVSDGQRAQYSTFSLWDTYRAAHPLYTILQPEGTADFVNSMLGQYKVYGYLPIWQLWGQENYCMIGNHAIPVIVDAVLKGVPGINAEAAYKAVKESSLISHPNSLFDVWEKYGYMPENIQTQSVSISLEIAYDDWCVAQLAKRLGKNDDYKHFMKRALFYKNLYNQETSFFQSKDDKGNWLTPFDPFKYGSNGGYPFTEGNAWQYFWYVPHDMSTLVEMVGGDKAFVKKLDDFFTLGHDENSGELNDNASGFIGQYAHGNEPSHHVSYLYNYAGEPAKTQFYVNKILTELYDTTSAGYAGNDDCGEMSAWYVFSALGFYPVNPANGVYVIGSPLVTKAVIDVGRDKTFIIYTPPKSEDQIYIQSVKLNGKPYQNTFIRHSDIVNGGTLDFVMGNKPSKWGAEPKNRPVDF